MAGKFIMYLYLLMFWSGYELNVTVVFTDSIHHAHHCLKKGVMKRGLEM